MYSVKVAVSHQHATATINSRSFSKIAAVILSDDEMTDEIKNSPILDVKRVRQARKRRAKKSPVQEPSVEETVEEDAES